MEFQKFTAKSSPRLFLAISAIGLAGCLLSFFQNKTQFMFSYLTSFVFFLSLALGGLFFVLIQHLTRAGWSVVVRRLAENVSANLQWMWVLVIPMIALGTHDLFHWTDHHVMDHDPILKSKEGYLNLPFFLIRAVLFFGVWFWLSTYFLKKSVAQDESGDKNLTLSMQKMSALAIILFGLSITFFSVDWIKSLNPHWFSTIFGVYYFACAVVGILSLLIMMTMFLQKSGHLKGIVTVEHYHDLGKLLFGFNIFWTYIAFSQWMLQWYANLGEETPFYFMRLQGSWKTYSILLPILHFAIPFLFLLSRNVKRHATGLFCGALWLFVANFMDIYWLIMPNHDTQGVHFTMGDISAVLFMGGLFFYFTIKKLEKSSLVPIKDPRLSESLHFTNA